MEKKELLDALNGLVGRYEQHRHYIEKAKAQAATGKFNNAVVEKVILDHEIKASDLADQVAPLLPRLSELSAGLEGDRARIEASKGTVDEQIQEFELRAAIGELGDEDFEKSVAELRQSQATANERIAAIDADLGDLRGALTRWADVAGPAGHYQAPAAPAPAVEEAAPAEVVEEASPEEEEEAIAAEEPVADDAVSSMVSHAIRTPIREDVSPIFEGAIPEAAQVRVAQVEEDIAIEAAEVNGEDIADGPSADVQFGFEEDILGGGAAGGEVEIDLAGEAGPAPVVSNGAGSAGGLETATGTAEQPRRALLLYQEGTAEEQIYPFTGDCLTIGRGRENDIQIKNDSKVSRYHCKIFRRGNNFYIEDQKSSNGSLVNGELVTDRRLFGGEEIVIGETFFRFRIME